MTAEPVQLECARAEELAAADKAPDAYRAARIEHWNQVSQFMEQRRRLSSYYHRRLREIYRFFCPPGKRVLEVGCAHADLLAALGPNEWFVDVGVHHHS